MTHDAHNHDNFYPHTEIEGGWPIDPERDARLRAACQMPNTHEQIHAARVAEWFKKSPEPAACDDGLSMKWPEVRAVKPPHPSRDTIRVAVTATAKLLAEVTMLEAMAELGRYDLDLARKIRVRADSISMSVDLMTKAFRDPHDEIAGENDWKEMADNANTEDDE